MLSEDSSKDLSNGSSVELEEFFALFEAGTPEAEQRLDELLSPVEVPAQVKAGKEGKRAAA